MIDITQIAVAVIGLLGIIITSVIVPLIKQKVTTEQWNNIIAWTSAAVQAAEVIYKGAGRGEEKRQYVMEYVEKLCAEHSIKIDTETIRIALENAWKTLIKQ